MDTSSGPKLPNLGGLPTVGERMLAIATLAAGIIQARGATSIEAISDAYWDAMYIVDPVPSEGRKAWLQENGLTAEEA